MKQLEISQMNLKDEKDVQFLDGFKSWAFFQTDEVENEENFLSNISSLFESLEYVPLQVESSSNVYWIIVVTKEFVAVNDRFIS